MTARVLVLGGGLTALQVAAGLIEEKVEVLLVEQRPVLGGKRAAWLCGQSEAARRLVNVAGHAAVECLTLASLESISGEAGKFRVRVRQQPRYVSSDCTRCNRCVPVCPAQAPNEYDAGLTWRKAIHSPHPRTVPDIYAIDVATCLNDPPNYQPCERCIAVCEDLAIDFGTRAPDAVERDVVAIIVATGSADNSIEARAVLAEFGYGAHPDIVSSVELQHLLEDPGPSGGYAIRPSDQGFANNVLLVLTRVGADVATVATSQLSRLAEQGVRKIDLLVLSGHRDDPTLEALIAAASDVGVTVRFGNWIGVEVKPQAPIGGAVLAARYASLPDGKPVESMHDLVVLSSDTGPAPDTAAIAEQVGLQRDKRGYLTESRPGIYLAGGVSGDATTADSDMALTAVRAAMQHIPPTEEHRGETDPRAQAAIPDRASVERILHALFVLGEGR